MVPNFSNLLQLIDRFPDEKSCHQYLAGQRWDGVIECPFKECKGDTAWVFKDGIRYKCTCCKKIFTAKTGTIFENSKISLKTWFVAIYMVLHKKKGISSIQLSKDLGITQKSAWFLLQRIRTVLGNEEILELSGTVMADETFVGGKNKNRHANKKVKYSQGRSFKDKTPVLGLMEAESSRVSCFVVPDTSTKSIQPIVKEYVTKGSNFVSDEWKAYNGLNSYYYHYVIDHGRKEYVGEHGFSTNAIEGFWSLCKRAIIGIYHKTSRKHLQKYFF